MTDTINIPVLTRRQRLHDLGLAVLLTFMTCLHVIGLPLLVESGRIEAPFTGLEVVGTIPPATPLGVLLVVATFMPLAFRRVRPLTVLAATVVGDVLFRALVPDSASSVEIATFVALYTVGTIYPRKTLFAATLATVLVRVTAITALAPTENWLPLILQTATVPAFCAALGDAARSRRAYIAEVEQRAIDAEHTREEEALRRVEEERLRIARELHDVTAHSLSIIAVQAGAAERIVEKNPDAARQALTAIRTTSKGALDELRSMLGVMRGEGDPVPLAPVGRLSRLNELLEGVEAAGLEADLEVRGDLDGLPVFVDLSAYRIVQEALTNVVRHAAARRVAVALERKEGHLSIEVTDDGRGPAASGEASTGHGLIGMRERVVALGGTFEAGAGRDGGFTVRAILPVGKEA